MLRFEDFVPAELAPSEFGFFNHSSAVHEAFEKAVSRANEWMTKTLAEIVNVETVVLPNIHETDENGSADQVFDHRVKYLPIGIRSFGVERPCPWGVTAKRNSWPRLFQNMRSMPTD